MPLSMTTIGLGILHFKLSSKGACAQVLPEPVEPWLSQLMLILEARPPQEEVAFLCPERGSVLAVTTRRWSDSAE